MCGLKLHMGPSLQEVLGFKQRRNFRNYKVIAIGCIFTSCNIKSSFKAFIAMCPYVAAVCCDNERLRSQSNTIKQIE